MSLQIQSMTPLTTNNLNMKGTASLLWFFFFKFCKQLFIQLMYSCGLFCWVQMVFLMYIFLLYHLIY